jgi:hypothetical protein
MVENRAKVDTFEESFRKAKNNKPTNSHCIVLTDIGGRSAESSARETTNRLNFDKKMLSSYYEYCLDLYLFNHKGFLNSDKKRSIFISKIDSIIINSPRKGAPNAKKAINSESGCFEKIIVNKVGSVNCSFFIFEENASEDFIKQFQSFLNGNKIGFEVVGEDFKNKGYIANRLLNLYKDDLMNDGNYSMNMALPENIQTLLCSKDTNSLVNKGMDGKMHKFMQFKIQIDLNKLPEGELKDALVNHMSQKVSENGVEIVKFSADITNIVDRSFQKYLEENKLTFDANNPSPSLDSATRSNSITMQK